MLSAQGVLSVEATEEVTTYRQGYVANMIAMGVWTPKVASDLAARWDISVDDVNAIARDMVALMAGARQRVAS